MFACRKSRLSVKSFKPVLLRKHCSSLLKIRQAYYLLTRHQGNLAADENHGFPYESYIQEHIARRKRDFRYQVPKITNIQSEKGLLGGQSSNQLPVTNWCCSDYMKMSQHPLVMAAIMLELTGTRHINIQEELQDQLSEFHQKEAAMLFTSCYAAYNTTLSALTTSLPGCHVFFNSGNYHSLTHVIRGTDAHYHTFHGSVDSLEDELRSVATSAPKIVAFETLNPMTGAICPLEELCDVAHHYGALTFVDEAHAVGIYGNRGAGIGEEDNVLSKMDIISGTLGEAIGSIGGYVAGNAALVDMIRSYCSEFTLSTALPPHVAKGALTSIKILAGEEGKKVRSRHQDNAQYLRHALVTAAFPVLHCASHVVSIHVGDPKVCSRLSSLMLSSHGHYLQAINYPTVTRCTERLRIVPTAFHTKQEMDKLVQNLQDVWDRVQHEMLLAESVKECSSCKQPLYYDQLTTRVLPPCGVCHICPQVPIL